MNKAEIRRGLAFYGFHLMEADDGQGHQVIDLRDNSVRIGGGRDIFDLPHVAAWLDKYENGAIGRKFGRGRG